MGLEAVTDLIKLFTGNSGGSNTTTTTSGRIGTKQTRISSELATQMLQNALESNQGLAAIAQGQAGAGMYNSTTNKLLTNDLLARLTANIAEKAAPTVESISPTTQTVKVANTVPSLKGQVPTLTALTLGKPLLDKVGKSKSIYDVVNNIYDFVTPAATLPATEALSSIGGLPAASAAPGSVLELLSATSQVSPIVYDALAPAADAISSALSFATSTAAIDTASSPAVLAGTSAALEGATADSLLGATATEAAIDSGILGGVGSEIGAAAGAGTAAELAAGAAEAADAGVLATAGLAAGAAGAAGLAADAGVLATAGVAAAEGGSVLLEAAPLLLWVICTELQDSGELPNELYLAGALRTINLPASVIRGYQWWAIPYTRLMRRSTLARKFIKPFAIARASYIATGKFNLAGWLSVVIGEPICAILGHTVAREKQNWEELYIG